MSVERAVSGPGIKCLYEFVIGTNKLVMDVVNADIDMEKYLKPLFKANELKQRFAPLTEITPEMDASAVVSKKALAGDPQCLALMALFFAWYGRFAADAAVTFAPKTIYLTGGIILKNMKLLEKKEFLAVFMNNYFRKARLAHIPATTELKIILDGDCGLLGCVEAIDILLK